MRLEEYDHSLNVFFCSASDKVFNVDTEPGVSEGFEEMMQTQEAPISIDLRNLCKWRSLVAENGISRQIDLAFFLKHAIQFRIQLGRLRRTKRERDWNNSISLDSNENTSDGSRHHRPCSVHH
jgi:hypothetical protein